MTNEQLTYAIGGQVVFLCILIGVLVAMSFRGSHWFRMRPALNGASTGRQMPPTAKLPPELRTDAPKTISELNAGETGCATFTNLYVRENGDCFLRARAELRMKAVNTVEVRRDDAGYHVVIPASIKYTPGAIPSIDEKLPVASIVVGPED